MSTPRSIFPRCLLGLALMAALPAASRADYVFDVTLDTTPLQANAGGAPYAIDFTLTAIGGSPNTDTATITRIGLGTGGAATGSPGLTGGATGSLTSGVTLVDSAPLTDFNQTFTPGDILTFRVVLTTAANAPAPDNFSFSILDSSGFALPTTDPSSADTLLSTDITGPSPFINTYASDPGRAFPGGEAGFLIGPPVVTLQGVPEPASATMLVLGLSAATAWARRRRSAA